MDGVACRWADVSTRECRRRQHPLTVREVALAISEVLKQAGGADLIGRKPHVCRDHVHHRAKHAAAAASEMALRARQRQAQDGTIKSGSIQAATYDMTASGIRALS